MNHKTAVVQTHVIHSVLPDKWRDNFRTYRYAHQFLTCNIFLVRFMHLKFLNFKRTVYWVYTVRERGHLNAC